MQLSRGTPFCHILERRLGTKLHSSNFSLMQPEVKARFNFGMDKQISNSVNFTHVQQQSQSLISNRKTLGRNKWKSQAGRCKICRKRFCSQDKLEIHLALHAAGSTKVTTKRCFLCRFCNTKHYGLRAILDHQSLNVKCRPVIHQSTKENTQEGTTCSLINRSDPGLSISLISAYFSSFLIGIQDQLGTQLAGLLHWQVIYFARLFDTEFPKFQNSY